MFRVISILLAAYFVLAAGLQYNDPDPLHWMLLYLTSALTCVLAAIRKDSLPLIYASIGMASIEIAITADGFFTWLKAGNENLIVAKMSAEKPYIELGREFLGAMISLVVAIWLWYRKR
ncbi:transmembrane 220 family protein [Leptospira langatensis]|nr:transmembrane 220 family protein [Leptospira langatensis]